jgi:hypothetical protein
MRRDKERMTFGLKALLSIAPLLLFLASSIAAEVTYKDYTEARSETWKGGFVFAISQYMMTVAQPGEEPPIRCRLPISDASRTRRMIFSSETSRHMSQEVLSTPMSRWFRS